MDHSVESVLGGRGRRAASLQPMAMGSSLGYSRASANMGSNRLSRLTSQQDSYSPLTSRRGGADLNNSYNFTSSSSSQRASDAGMLSNRHLLASRLFIAFLLIGQLFIGHELIGCLFISRLLIGHMMIAVSTSLYQHINAILRLRDFK